MDKTLDAHSEVQSFAFSPDGRRIVCGAGTGEALGTPLQGHTASVRSVVISSDGHRFVSASWDKTMRVWGMETRETLGAPIRGHTDYIECVAIASDGQRIVSGYLAHG
jgi:WD40 repeat protein